MLTISFLLLTGCAQRESISPKESATSSETQVEEQFSPMSDASNQNDLLSGLNISANAKKKLESYGDNLYGIHRLTDGWYLLWMSTATIPEYEELYERNIILAFFDPVTETVTPVWTSEGHQQEPCRPMFFDLRGIWDEEISYSRIACVYGHMKTTWLFFITPNLIGEERIHDPATVGATPFDSVGTEPIMIQHEGLNQDDPIWVMEVPFETILAHREDYILKYGDYTLTAHDLCTFWPDGFTHPEYLSEDTSTLGAEVLEEKKDELTDLEYAFFSEHLPFLRGMTRLKCGAILFWYSTQVDFKYCMDYGEDLKFGVAVCDAGACSYHWYWLANEPSEVAGTDIFYRNEEDRLKGRSCMFPNLGIPGNSLIFVSTDGKAEPYDSIGTEPIIFNQPGCNNGLPLYIFELDNEKDITDSYRMFYGDLWLTGRQFWHQEWEP